ncbi:RNA-binding protein 5 [Angomonas deanei]|uniref:RNA recognition motif. (A.k.a. RRM, RBD, or RNP domain), putative n=1 Tax=Angomonas deanei TaxID=59799 RepID=A0A7G2CL03_9TRYP|nr:RNA-binding protein 5 [Angomonas deanei]CAD2220540.1 RNA recognition motif. (a.k.a. RRM, RBD, or RNP domain), putative [Angomonas deanei]|eukprot:EPY21702.1 RNA-binding protein 5 [Angomonas deanei]
MKHVTADANCNVYAAGLPPNFSDQQLFDLFSIFGRITSARIMRSKGNRESKGYGFVLFKTEEEAQQAVYGLNGHIVQDFCLQVRLADPIASGSLRKISKKQAALTEAMEQRSSTPESSVSEQTNKTFAPEPNTLSLPMPAAQPTMDSTMPFFFPQMTMAPMPMNTMPMQMNTPMMVNPQMMMNPNAMMMNPMTFGMPQVQQMPMMSYAQPSPCLILMPDGNFVPYTC